MEAKNLGRGLTPCPHFPPALIIIIEECNEWLHFGNVHKRQKQEVNKKVMETIKTRNYDECPKYAYL